MPKQFTRSLTTTLALLILVTVQSVQADWDVNFGGISESDPQDVVISLATDPNHDPEAACLAVTFARSLTAPNPNFPTSEVNVTLFVTLDGVNLAREDYISRKRLKEYECTTPWGKVSLADHLTAYIAGNDNRMMVCPICWKERYENESPDYGAMPGVDGVPGTAIGTMMFNADKILSF